MVSISLRSYINEINDMVDQHQIDEAIAHCRHILEQYPKHVDTYRLLGKAYLEEQRYGDAADILQRVLSSVPEDFIAQVGMSIIREDEGNLDSAIYHMERAFETQPSNHAIQNELRRLNTKRDGIELTRVRLTRGALARMYAHGHLYDQAISELLAALSEDPNRFDLQNLLAKMYYKTEKKVDSAETCTKILEKLPHCINANQLLTQILEESGRPEEAKRYRQRWAALDPYSKFIGEEYSLLDTVPDNQVTLEQLDWDPSGIYAEEEQPAWASSLGLSLEDSGEGKSLPDWLGSSPDDELGDVRPTEMLPSDEADSLFSDEPTTLDGKRIGLIPQAESEEEDQADDWLSSLDSPVIEDTSPSDPAPFSFDEEDEEGDDADEWLASLETDNLGRSSEKDDLFTEQTPADGTEGDADDWLASLDAPEEEPAPAEDDLFPTDSKEDDADDWLASLEEPAPVEDALFPTDSKEDDADDWLASLDAPEKEPAPAGDALFTTDSEDDDDDGWLASLEEKAADTLPTPEEVPSPDPEPELPDFLKDAGWEAGSGEADESGSLEFEEDQLAEAEIPDWIQEMAPADEQVEEKEDPEAEADPEWMKSLEAHASSPADWMKELDETEPEETEAPQQVPEPEESAAKITPGEAIEADDADMAWLENLAAKQGIPDEEMTTTAEQRAEVTEEETEDTDWLNQIGLSEPTDQQEIPEETESVGEETSAWLKSIKEEETTAPEADSEDTISRFLAAKAVLGEEESPETPDQEEVSTDWLKSVGQEAADEAADPPESEPVEAASPVDEEADSFDTSWLDAIGAEAAQEAATDAGESPVEEPAPIEDAPADDDWLAELDDSSDQPADGDDQEEISTDWLKAIGQEAAEEAAEILESEPAEAASPVDEEADSFDSSWLDAIGAEAAQEAAADAGEAPVEEPAPVEDAPADDDWLAEMGATEEAAPEPESPIDEEKDDFDMDWLDEIGAEAAQEAAADVGEAPVEEPAPKKDAPADDDWLSELDDSSDQSADGDDQEEVSSDWLKAIGQEAAEILESEPAEAASPVDEEADSFDTSWLDAIGAEPAQEAAIDAGEAPVEEPAPIEDAPADDDWLAEMDSTEDAAPEPKSPIDEEKDDFDMDWLNEIGAEAAQEAAADDVSDAPIEEPAPVEETPADDDWLAEMGATEEATPEPVPPVDEEEDDFDMDWLNEIGAEAAQEAAADAVDDAPIEEPAPVEDAVIEIADTEIQAEPATEQAEEPIDDWFAEIEAKDDLEQGESISDTDAWLLSMDQEEEPVSQPEEPAAGINDSDEWLSTLGIQPDEDQQVIDQQIPEPTTPPTDEVVQPIKSDEWLPESEVEPVPEPEPKADPIAEDLADARQSVQENDLPEALKTYARIIKKGKLVEEIIQDLNDALIRHPINAKLWQILGDAHLRVDNLQEALDAYSKAEDLLR